MTSLVQDGKYALRTLWRSRGFAAVAVATLALGIGVNTALFSVANFMLQERPNGFVRPEELVQLWGQMISKKGAVGDGTGLLPYEAYPAYYAATDVVDLAGWCSFGVKAVWHDNSSPAGVEVVSGNYFDVLGVKPALGRSFRGDETEPAIGPPVVIVSDRAWHRRFDGTSDILGQTVKFNGQPFTVIGVGPKDFAGHSGADFWVATAAYDHLFPEDAGALREPGHWSWFFTGRLRPNVSLAQAQARMTAIADSAQPFADRLTGASQVHTVTALLQPMIGGGDAEQRRSFVFVVGAYLALGGLVLLVACANVCNLLLARAEARHREMAVRAALGASRSRLIRQLLTESVLLAALGGLCGLVLAHWTKNLIVAWWWPGLERVDGPRPVIDPLVLAYTAALLALATLCFGLLPALRLSGLDLVSALKTAGGTAGSRSRLSGALVVAQVAIAFALLIVSGLLVQSMRAAQQTELGFDSHHLLTAGLNLGFENYPKSQWQSLYRDLTERLATLPGVRSASAAQGLPLIGWNFTLFRIEGAAEDVGSQQAWFAWGDPSYLPTLGIPILTGRNFEPTDDGDHPGVAIVNKSFAEKYWPGRSALGHVLTLDATRGKRVEIVGICADAKFGDFRENNSRSVFLSLYQNGMSSGRADELTLLVRTTGDPKQSIAALRQVVKQVGGAGWSVDAGTYDKLLDRRSFFIFRIGAVFATALAVLALILAIVGLYGLLAFGVSQRTQEVGVRMALGAYGNDVIWIFVRRGLLLTASGLVTGLVLALSVRKLITAYLYGIGPTDLATFSAVPVVLAIVAAVASYLPARRATRVDPMIALRSE